MIRKKSFIKNNKLISENYFNIISTVESNKEFNIQKESDLLAINSERISTILKKYVLSKMNSLQILKVYLWEYRRKVELLHLQSQADLIKEFCILSKKYR